MKILKILAISVALLFAATGTASATENEDPYAGTLDPYITDEGPNISTPVSGTAEVPTTTIDELSETGSDSLSLAIIGFGLIVLGVLLFVLTLRSRA